MKKQNKKKNEKVSSMAEQDIVGLLTTLVGKLTSFEAKIDMVCSRIQAVPVAAVQQKTHIPAQEPQRRPDPRPMYKAVCADCRKTCEVPFRPSTDRPVYCKACYAHRRHNGSFNPHGNKMQINRPDIAKSYEKPQVPAPVKAAKPVKKKRPVKKKNK